MSNRGLSRLPFSFWLVFSIFICYTCYNPIWDISSFMALPIFWGLKVLVAGFLCGALLLYITEGGKSLSPMGFLVLTSILGAAVATLMNAGWLSTSSIRWWLQIPLGTAMSVALRWSSIYRAITGRVGVTTANDDNAGVHHG